MLRRRWVQYINSPWGLRLLGWSCVAAILTGFVLLVLLGVRIPEGLFKVPETAILFIGLLLLAASPLIVIFNLICFLVWWAFRKSDDAGSP